MIRTDDPEIDYITLPEPISSILDEGWFEAKERYADQIRASQQARRIIMAQTEADRRQAREAEQQAQAEIRQQYRAELDRLLRLISFDRDAVLQTLGLAEMVSDYEAGGYL